MRMEIPAQITITGKLIGKPGSNAQHQNRCYMKKVIKTYQF